MLARLSHSMPSVLLDAICGLLIIAYVCFLGVFAQGVVVRGIVYLSFAPIEKILCFCDLSVHEKDWGGKPGLLAHAQHTEP